MKKAITVKKSRALPETLVKFETVLGYMLSGTKSPNDDKIKPYQPMTMKQAVKEIGMSEQNFIYYIKTYPALKEKYEMIRQTKRETIGNIAENNLHLALDGGEIGELDKAKLSLDYLKQTDRNYNQKVEVEQTVKSINFNISEEELKQRIFDLMNK